MFYFISIFAVLLGVCRGQTPVKLTQIQPIADQNFGASIAYNDVHIVVGAPDDDAVNFMGGAAYILTETRMNARDWNDNVVKVTSEDTLMGDSFGHAVGINSRSIFIGAPDRECEFSLASTCGMVYIYSESDEDMSDWLTQPVIKLLALDAEGSNSFGSSISTYDLQLVIGAWGDATKGTAAGAAYLYVETSEGALDWESTPEIKLVPSYGSDWDWYGRKSSIYEEQLVITAYNDAYNNKLASGSVYCYHSEDPLLHTSENAVNIKVPGSPTGPYFGYGIAVYESTLAVGAPKHSENGTYAGRVYLYRESSYGAQDWEQYMYTLWASTSRTGGYFGNSVALQGNTLVVGSPGEKSGSSGGHAYVYEGWTDRPEPDAPWLYWNETRYWPRPEGTTKDMFGITVLIKNMSLVMGAPYNNNPMYESGTAYVFPYCPKATGFMGDNCEIDINDCTSNPCQNDGICKDTGTNSFHCNCTDTGFTGSLCEIDVDDCLSSPCDNNGICTDTGTNTFICDCSSTGFGGVLCDVDSNDCASSPCQFGVCMDTGNKAFACECDPGYEGDLCQSDVNECLSSPCYNGALCTDLGVLNFSCDCTGTATGYTGTYCSIDIDDCMSTPCANDGICTDLPGNGGFTCNCDEIGFEGIVCELDSDDCASSPCYNGGICIDNGVNLFSCHCDDIPYEGDLCELDVDDCSSSPCLNAGVCTDLGANLFTCTCTEGNYGRLCHLENTTSSSSSSSSLPLECEMKECLQYDVTVRLRDITAVEYEHSLPDKLSLMFNNSANSYGIDVIEHDDGSVTYSITFYDRNSTDYVEVDAALGAQDSPLHENVDEVIIVRVSGDIPNESDGNSNKNQSNDDDGVIIALAIIVVVLLVVMVGGYNLYKQKLQGKVPVFKMPS